MLNPGLTKAEKPECCILFRRETESCSFTIDRADRLKKGFHLRPGGGATCRIMDDSATAAALSSLIPSSG